MLLLSPVQVVWLIMLLPLLTREQILGEDQRPLVVRKGKKLKEDHPKREVPPDAPIIDVSWDICVVYSHTSNEFHSGLSEVTLAV